MSETIVQSICLMPVAFRERDLSMVDLLRETKYLDTPEEITESSIETYLRTHPELVDAWVLHSENQRCTPSWYLLEPTDLSSDRGWVVGFVPESGFPGQQQKFSSRYAACAHFIKRYIELVKEHM